MNPTQTIKKEVPQSFEFSFQDLEIDASRVLRLMGFRKGEAPEPYPEMLQKELETIGEYGSAKGGYMMYSNIEVSPGYFSIDKTEFNVGKQISGYLKNAQVLCVFACTAGSEISQRAKDLAEQGQVLESYITDVIGSVVVETAMDKIYQKLKVSCAEMNMQASNRYSPGYCDWDVSEQHKLFKFLPANQFGIRLNESALMTPIKSVSGVIALGDNVKYRPYLCDACNSNNCIYRGKK